MLGSGWASLLASLYGGSTGITSATPGIACSGADCSFDSSPMTPMIVRYVPRLRWAFRPSVFDPLDDVVDLLVGGAGFENDDHG